MGKKHDALYLRVAQALHQDDEFVLARPLDREAVIARMAQKMQARNARAVTWLDIAEAARDVTWLDLAEAAFDALETLADADADPEFANSGYMLCQRKRLCEHNASS